MEGEWKFQEGSFSFDFERPTCCRVSWRCTTRRPKRKFFRCCFIICLMHWSLRVLKGYTLLQMAAKQNSHEFSSNDTLATESVHELYGLLYGGPGHCLASPAGENGTSRPGLSQTELHSSSCDCKPGKHETWLHDMNEQIDTMIWIQYVYLYQCIWYHD